MDMKIKVLAPDRLAADPNSPTAEKEYTHWRRNFNYFLEDVNEHSIGTAG